MLQGEGKTCDNWLSKNTWSVGFDFDQEEGELIIILDLGVLISLGELKDFSEIISEIILVCTYFYFSLQPKVVLIFSLNF